MIGGKKGFFISNMINECIMYANMGLNRKLREYGLKKNRQWWFLSNFNTVLYAWEQCFNVLKFARSMH